MGCSLHGHGHGHGGGSGGHNHSHSKSDEESSSGDADKSAGGHNHQHVDNMNGRLRFCEIVGFVRRHINDLAILFSAGIISIIVHVQTF
jgi:hypothetical protein